MIYCSIRTIYHEKYREFSVSLLFVNIVPMRNGVKYAETTKESFTVPVLCRAHRYGYGRRCVPLSRTCISHSCTVGKSIRCGARESHPYPCSNRRCGSNRHPRFTYSQMGTRCGRRWYSLVGCILKRLCYHALAQKYYRHSSFSYSYIRRRSASRNGRSMCPARYCCRTGNGECLGRA